MKSILRGPRASRLLGGFGVDPKRFWLLVDLFAELSDRGEMMDQLGRDGVALRTVSWLYFGMSALFGIALVLVRAPVATYMIVCLALTLALLSSILLSETANTLVNPVEALVLAHQPVNGATYTGAKLAHLLAIILFLVPGLSVAPAVAGVFARGASWWYPFLHLAAAFALALAAALASCALFGWLLRFLAPARLKAAAQVASAAPVLVIFGWQYVVKAASAARLDTWMPASPAARIGLAAAAVLVALVAVVFGIRSLSADYLVRVAGLVRGGAAAGSTPKRSLIGDVVARWAGGPPARAAAAFVSRMMLRDFQFRRQMIPSLIPIAVMLVTAVVGSWRTDPFSGRFTAMHAMPHALGFVLLTVCSILPYGAHHKGRWIFQFAPSGSLAPFARGVHGALWLELLAVPHVAAATAFGFAWGFWHAALFTAYSLAVSSIYLALELKLVDAVPFTKPFDPKRGAGLLPMMMIGAIVVGIMMAVQYAFLFRSETAALVATALASVVAWWVTRKCLNDVEGAWRYDLAMLSHDAGTLYTEIQ